jgi:adenine-specific DNA methylase
MTPRRLIEEELPIARLNAESGREKSLRHGNISTSHLWWARRTLAMSRAVVTGSLVPANGRSKERKALLDAIAIATRFENSNNAAMLRPLRDAISEAFRDRRPNVLDCFAGGGAIPLEAIRLGCDTTALELNPGTALSAATLSSTAAINQEAQDLADRRGCSHRRPAAHRWRAGHHQRCHQRRRRGFERDFSFPV